MSLRSMRRRETGAWTHRTFQRALYETVVPNAAAYHVSGAPDAHLCRFTPDGRYLIAFGQNSLSLILYRFESGGHRRGQSRAATRERRVGRPRAPGVPAPGYRDGLCQTTNTPMDTPRWTPASGYPAPPPPPGGPRDQHPVPSQRPVVARPKPQRDWNDVDENGVPFTCPFQRFFSLRYEKSIAQGGERLSKDVCLVTDNQRFVILCSATPPLSQDSPEETFEDETDAVNNLPKHDVIVFYLVEIETGTVVDTFSLHNDYVHLKVEGHLGVDLHQDVLAILSMKRQELVLVRIQQGGSFSQPVRVGSLCKDDDAIVLSTARDAARHFSLAGNHPSDAEKSEHVAARRKEFIQLGPTQELNDNKTLGTGLGNGLSQSGMYMGLMHQLMAYVFRRESHLGRQIDFFRNFRRYSDLIMLKAQVINSDNLLIRLGRLDPDKPEWVFVVFNLTNGTIVAVLDNIGAFQKLLRVYVSRIREFWRVTDSLIQPNDFEANQAIRSLAKNQGRMGLRGLNQALRGLPVSIEAKCLSPYLNADMYSYDEHKLEALDGSGFMECSEYPSVKFTLRRTGGLRFKITPGAPGASGGLGRNKKTFRLVFHPRAPFGICVQKSALQQTAISFHYRLA